jgi:hypothetical protein
MSIKPKYDVVLKVYTKNYPEPRLHLSWGDPKALDIFLEHIEEFSAFDAQVNIFTREAKNYGQTHEWVSISLCYDHREVLDFFKGEFQKAGLKVLIKNTNPEGDEDTKEPLLLTYEGGAGDEDTKDTKDTKDLPGGLYEYDVSITYTSIFYPDLNETYKFEVIAKNNTEAIITGLKGFLVNIAGDQAIYFRVSSFCAVLKGVIT